MILILVYLAIISVSAYGNVVKEKTAISTQSFNRPDIPISQYKLTNVHNYKRENKPEHNRQLESILMRYPVIQYAPLSYDTKQEDHREHHYKINKQKTKFEPVSVNTGRHVYTGHEKSKHNNLEPKSLKEDDNVNQHNYRSFISGHNVETYTETTGQYVEQGVDSFVTHQDYHQKQKVKPPKFVYYQKTKDISVVNPPKVHNIVEDQHATGDFKFLEFLPDNHNSARKEHKKSLPYAYSLHNQLSLEKPQQNYAHPRIHLNIARTYNIGYQPQESHISPIFAKKSLSNSLLDPQNTLMLPVRNG